MDGVFASYLDPSSFDYVEPLKKRNDETSKPSSRIRGIRYSGSGKEVPSCILKANDFRTWIHGLESLANFSELKRKIKEDEEKPRRY